MVRPFWSICLASVIGITLMGGCARKQRAREREAIEAKARAEARSKEAARLAALPLPEEPPVELLRATNSGLPCEVDDVFAAKCRRCHTIPTRHGAPFVFLTWQDMQQERAGQKLPALIARAVRSNFMPYRMEANPPVLPLTDDEKQIILDWVDAGAPRQDCDPSAQASEKVGAKPIKSALQPPPTRARPSASVEGAR
jgi:hypothetical protein